MIQAFLYKLNATKSCYDGKQFDYGMCRVPFRIPHSQIKALYQYLEVYGGIEIFYQPIRSSEKVI